MKERFYNFIKFISDIHLIDFSMYTAIALLALEVYKKYELSFNSLKVVVLVIIAGAFMYTWEIESKKKKRSEK